MRPDACSRERLKRRLTEGWKKHVPPGWARKGKLILADFGLDQIYTPRFFARRGRNAAYAKLVFLFTHFPPTLLSGYHGGANGGPLSPD
jgi:hypothetical protein